jgi:hypothetical protein
MTRINTSTPGGNIMPQINPDDLELQRDSVRDSLNEINNDIAMEMRDAGFGGIPVYLMVPNSGDAIATAATPLDHVPHGEWSQVLEIACRVIQRRIGSGKLCSRELTCTAINTAIASADVTAE